MKKVNFYLSKVDREKLPRKVFGLPDKLLFPILSADDVMSAAKLLGRAKISEEERQKAKKRIINIAKRDGYAIPDTWKAEMSYGDIPEILAMASFNDTPQTNDPVCWEANGETYIGKVVAINNSVATVEVLDSSDFSDTGLRFSCGLDILYPYYAGFSKEELKLAKAVLATT